MIYAYLVSQASLGQRYIYLDVLSYSARWFLGRSISSPGSSPW
jgi:hypothetical protein